MVENNSATAFTCPLYRSGASGIGNNVHKRPTPLLSGTFDEHSKVVT